MCFTLAFSKVTTNPGHRAMKTVATTKDVDSILREPRHCWRKKLLPGYIVIVSFLSVCVCQVGFIIVVIAIIDSYFVCHHQFVYHCILCVYIYNYVKLHVMKWVCIIYKSTIIRKCLSCCIHRFAATQ